MVKLTVKPSEVTSETTNFKPNKTQHHQIVIVGGGAAGITTASLFVNHTLNKTSSLIIDKGKARSFWMQELHNYLGLPPDTPGRSVKLLLNFLFNHHIVI